jgi:hypothetical protein
VCRCCVTPLSNREIGPIQIQGLAEMMESSIINKNAQFSYGGPFRVLGDEGEYLYDSNTSTLSGSESNPQSLTSEGALDRAGSRGHQSLETDRAHESADTKLSHCRSAPQSSTEDSKYLELFDSHQRTHHVKWEDEQRASDATYPPSTRELTGDTDATGK